ncbi:serine/threonine-protein phosphatase 7 long form [Cinnamomum micranthum f. kanehirae]|uniref:Serine/threonine-protein phosphatase 7 long form n=1 Tax=Cinnamomum micranthum f. kanehirae TaxID=337451 RepID=A0A3S3N5N5_9MAGN|nr:serine/threonine-protein phosphatase 7 long form [Cinnamomum micranthum f. kanehirae]
MQNIVFSGLIGRLGLAPLVATSNRLINKNMVSAFVERWQPKTNTFHMLFGEMTITLDNVSTILGIPVTGKSVSVEQLSFERAMTLVEHGLGVTSQQAHEELVGVQGSSVRLEWLRDLFGDVTDVDPKEYIRHAARAYLLYLLGCTLFKDKSGTRVPVIYLKLLMNFDEARTYAWGAAALAYLYQQLGFATWSGVKQITGYLTLLEALIYEHFRRCRPNPNRTYTENLPRVHRWVPRRESGDQMSNLQSLREALDDLGAHEVVWDPYLKHMADHPFHEVAYYTGCLKCMDIVGPYHPDWVHRQFGRVQRIPPTPLAPQRAAVWLDQIWERWHNHLLSPMKRGVPVAHPSDCTTNYMNGSFECRPNHSCDAPDSYIDYREESEWGYM